MDKPIKLTEKYERNGWPSLKRPEHVHLVPREGGLPKKITDFATAASGPRFMPDSHGLIVTVERNDTDQLLLTNIDDCWPRALTTDTIGDHWDARPSPDGLKWNNSWIGIFCRADTYPT